MISTFPEAFEQAIREEPDEPVHRLAYADWLQDADDPVQTARGEFIRLQCDLDQMSPDDPRREQVQTRERELREQFGRIWAAPIKPLVRGYDFRRGFVERIRLDAAGFVRYSDRLFQLAPIAEVELTARTVNLPALAASPHLARITSLELDCSAAIPSSLFRFFSSSLQHLVNLRIRALPPSLLQTLSLGHSLVRLETLDLAFNPLGPEGIETLAHSIRLPALRTLLVNYCQLGSQGVDVLARSPLLEQLSALDLRSNSITLAGASALAHSSRCRRLEVLWLGFNVLQDNGLSALAGSKLLPVLNRLYVGSNTLSGPGVEALARSPLLGQLTHLDLDYNDLSASSLEALARSPHLHRIQTLYLRCGRGLTHRVREFLRQRLGAGVCRL